MKNKTLPTCLCTSQMKPWPSGPATMQEINVAINGRIGDFNHGEYRGISGEITGEFMGIREIVIYHKASAPAIIVEPFQCVDARRCVVVLWSLK